MALHSRLAAIAATALFVPLGAFAQGLNVPAIHQAQAASILDNKAQRTSAEKKLDDKILYTYRAMRNGARRNSVTPGVPGFVQGYINSQTDSNLATYVSIKASATGDLAAWLQSVGATELNEFAEYHNVTAVIPVAQLLALASRPEVQYIGPRERATTNRYFPTLDAKKQAIADAIGAVPNFGPNTWRGVTAHNANLAHQTGITGAGVKVCVLSDGVNALAARQAAGELPAVDVLAGQAGNGNEGTAMLEIIADMAPGASLGFATAFTGNSQFATNIRNLQSQRGCNIIVDDVTYFYEAAFNDDDIAGAVNAVNAAGVLYFSSAANSGNLTHNNGGTYEGDFNLSGTAMPAVIEAFEGGPGTGTLHQFPSGPFTTLAAGTNTNGRTSLISLKWSDASNSAGNDYDLFVTDSTGTTIYGASASFQGGAGFAPFEIASCDVTRESLDPPDLPHGHPGNAIPSPCDVNGTAQCLASDGQANCEFPAGSRIYVVKYASAPASVARALRLDTSRGTINAADRTTGSTFGHNAAASAFTVAASWLFDIVGTAPFTSANTVTYYSSDGPRRIFYNTVFDVNGAITAVNPITAGNFLFNTNGGTSLAKVDFTASDCGVTTTPGFATFCGTSAAAPTAAAIAALVKSAKPTATRAQIKTALINSAIDIEAGGVDRDSGAGIIMASNAVAGILTPLIFGKSFAPSPIAVGDNSTLTITVQNPNAIAINAVAFTDSYPAGIANAASPNAAVSGAGCTATLSATGAGNTFGVTNATIPASITCTFTVVVTATGGGILSDASGTVTTPIGFNAPLPTAGITVVAPTQQRAFVSAFGTDANTGAGCGPTTPCRGFAAAQGVLLPGGEIVALNAAGYGAITITKSMTIVANPGFYAGITAASGNAITIATPGVNVLLRGLNINGTGGTNGINMTAGTSLTVENCVISNFTGSGIKVDASGSTVRVANTVVSGNTLDGLTIAQGRADVVRSRALNNGRGGFMAFPSASSTAALSIVDSFSAGNQYGFAAIINAASAVARINAMRVSGVSNTNAGMHVQNITGSSVTGIVGNSMFSQNATAGMYNGGSSTLKSLGNNVVDLNGANTIGTITPVSGL